MKDKDFEYWWAEYLDGNNKGQIEIIKVKGKLFDDLDGYLAFNNLGYWPFKPDGDIRLIQKVEQPPKDAPIIEPTAKDDSVAKGECKKCKEMTGGCVDYNSDKCPIKSSETPNLKGEVVGEAIKEVWNNKHDKRWDKE